MSTLHNGYAKIFSSLVDVFPDTSNLLVSVGLVRYFLKHKPQDIHTIYRGMKKTFVSYKKKKNNSLFSCCPRDNRRGIEEAVQSDRKRLNMRLNSKRRLAFHLV